MHLLRRSFLLFPLGLTAQSPEVGERKRLIYHDIRTDKAGMILPWSDDDPGTAYDHVLRLVWTYWKNIPNYWSNEKPYSQRYRKTAGVKQYLMKRTLDDFAVGGDQFAMMLSSWQLYYQYSGDPEVLENMRFQADWYLANSLSTADCRWPFLPFPCNTERLPVYDGDLILGKGVTQPDKAGSFGAELVTLFKITGERKYLDAAVRIAQTLAAHVIDGDGDRSPLPFKVDVTTGDVKSGYTTNWAATLRLWEGLMGLGEGETREWQRVHRLVLDWMLRYPVRTNKWGPFFEDVPGWSDKEINAGTFAWYLMDRREADGSWQEHVRGAQDWVVKMLAIPYWAKYGVTAIGEQTAYKMQGQSHGSRHASVELRYAELSGDTQRKAEAVRLLNWCTYMVDVDGKNWYPNFEVYEIWWTDGYGDYVRHFLRAMAAAPELAPHANHLLRSSSVVQKISYGKDRLTYETFDKAGDELLRLTLRPRSVTCGGVPVKFQWTPLARGGVVKISRSGGSRTEVIL